MTLNDKHVLANKIHLITLKFDAQTPKSTSYSYIHMGHVLNAQSKQICLNICLSSCTLLFLYLFCLVVEIYLIEQITTDMCLNLSAENSTQRNGVMRSRKKQQQKQLFICIMWTGLSLLKRNIDEKEKKKERWKKGEFKVDFGNFIHWTKSTERTKDFSYLLEFRIKVVSFHINLIRRQTTKLAFEKYFVSIWLAYYTFVECVSGFRMIIGQLSCFPVINIIGGKNTSLSNSNDKQTGTSQKKIVGRVRLIDVSIGQK